LLNQRSINALKAVEALTTRWGRFVEELVEPAVIKLFRERGLDVTQTSSRYKSDKQGLAMEIDIIVVNGAELVAVECKSRLSTDDVNEFLEKLKLFKQAFPQYSSFDVYGAVAGIEIDEGVDKYAYKKGLFVIKPSGDTVEIVNDAKFKGRKW
jgi:predicted RecB family endonuclease